MGTVVDFLVNSILLGVGLAMDAFSVSLVNGLNEPKMKLPRMNMIAGTFSLFQFLMPILGWICVHTVLVYFQVFELFIPWIAMVLLSFIGGKMLWEGVNKKCECEECSSLGFKALMAQGVATSIDALSVGFTIAEYNILNAFLSCLIIAVVTFIICTVGLILGKHFGTKFAGKANIFGGLILIFIGIRIFVSGVFF